MLKASIIVSFLSAMIGVEVPSTPTSIGAQSRAADSSLLNNLTSIEDKQIEEDARRSIGKSLIDDE